MELMVVRKVELWVFPKVGGFMTNHSNYMLVHILVPLVTKTEFEERGMET